MTEPRLRESIDAAIADRRLVEYAGVPPGGGDWQAAALLATVAVLREWGVAEDDARLVPWFEQIAIATALDRLTALPTAIPANLRADVKPHPGRAGKGAVQRAAASGSRAVRTCPRCRTPICSITRSSTELWIALEGKRETHGGVVDVRPAATHDYASQVPALIDEDGIPWPHRDVTTLYRPPVTVRCHGGSRTLRRTERGAERCGALIRIDAAGEAHAIDEADEGGVS